MNLRLWPPVTCSTMRMIFFIGHKNKAKTSALQVLLLSWTVEAPSWCARALQQSLSA